MDHCILWVAEYLKYLGVVDTMGFKIIMRTFMTTINICPFYVINYEMMEWMKNKMDLWLFKVAFNFLTVMTLISYFTAALRPPKIIPQVSKMNTKQNLG